MFSSYFFVSRQLTLQFSASSSGNYNWSFMIIQSLHISFDSLRNKRLIFLNLFVCLNVAKEFISTIKNLINYFSRKNKLQTFRRPKRPFEESLKSSKSNLWNLCRLRPCYNRFTSRKK